MPHQEKFKWILISFVVSIILLVVKFYGYYVTQSNAILTDALESIVNVVASGFAFYSIYLSSMPRDENHPYGHGKIEFFSAGLEGVLIILAGLFIIYQSIYTLIFPIQLTALPLGMVLVGFSGLANGLLGYLLLKKGKKLNSLTLEADGKHVSTDAVSSLVLLLGIGLMYFSGYYWLDSFLSLLFATYILYNGYFLVRKSVAGLMDEINPANLQPAVKLLNKHRKITWIDIHNMRVQQYGGDRHIDLHLTLPYYFNLRQVHDEVENVEDVLGNQLPGMVEVFIHADPCIPEKCCHYCMVKNCPVRRSPNSVKIKWTSELMAKNQKHYHETTENP
ncbi:cation diffusion facilitator family transporter [Pararhodonellum marinum]|uniref:cation diffusion facilitator family transporter n=1 Tax=Pararhodonellum marinum TaxID=2755358 RepID=UPI00188FFE22|nr:cation diffusion facilitator family transporter [Pararhodonellum marinum]